MLMPKSLTSFDVPSHRLHNRLRPCCYPPQSHCPLPTAHCPLPIAPTPVPTPRVLVHDAAPAPSPRVPIAIHSKVSPDYSKPLLNGSKRAPSHPSALSNYRHVSPRFAISHRQRTHFAQAIQHDPNTIADKMFDPMSGRAETIDSLLRGPDKNIWTTSLTH
jgi:hypothetical protein